MMTHTYAHTHTHTTVSWSYKLRRSRSASDFLHISTLWSSSFCIILLHWLFFLRLISCILCYADLGELFWHYTPIDWKNTWKPIHENIIDMYVDYLLWPFWLNFYFSKCAGIYLYICAYIRTAAKHCSVCEYRLSNVCLPHSPTSPESSDTCLSSQSYMILMTTVAQIVCENRTVRFCALGNDARRDPFIKWKLYLYNSSELMMKDSLGSLTFSGSRKVCVCVCLIKRMFLYYYMVFF